MQQINIQFPTDMEPAAVVHLPMGFSVSVLDMYHRKQWDPTASRNEPPILDSALNRIKKDLMSIYQDPPPGIHVTASESDIRDIHALVVGPADTPYQGGMFYFFLKCPYNFPLRPPKVRLMTTDAGKVRFNPNMYPSGRVCLSIIGTWRGPSWKPAQQIASLLISIQSLMAENPIFNEPGYSGIGSHECKNYNDMVAHETIRVAVIGMLENECHLNMPEDFVPVMEDTFLKNFLNYVCACNNRLSLDGLKYLDPLNPSSEVVFNFKGLLDKLYKLKEKIIGKKSTVTELLSDLEGSEYETDDEEEDKIEENEGPVCSSSSVEKTEEVTKEDSRHSEEKTDLHCAK